jgi:hypothetical protein
MSATLNRLWCALFRHAPSRVVERVGEWTIRECPRCGEWWAEPSVKWLLYEDARRRGVNLTEVHRTLIDRAARGVDKKVMEGVDNRGK